VSYDPFARGPHPVGVRSRDLHDAARSRHLPVEIWYPAAPRHAGEDQADATRDRYSVLPGFPPSAQDAVRDAAPADGRFPVIVFSHGFAGHRRQTTHFCTHLASHGYVVVSPDHTGNTIVDVFQQMMAAQASGVLPDVEEAIRPIIEARPRDASHAVDALVAGAEPELADRIDATRIGVTGHSFGGWTTLAVAGRDPRVRAALPLAPAGGRAIGPAETLRRALDLAWPRPIPTLFLVADRDTLLPLEGMHELYERTPGPARMAVLKRADHMHFCDRVEETHEMFRLMPKMGPFAEIAQGVQPMAELVPGAHAYDFVRGLGLAHFDAHLRDDARAAALLARDLVQVMKERGVEIEVA
jgi:dienelactone hydrolase